MYRHFRYGPGIPPNLIKVIHILSSLSLIICNISLNSEAHPLFKRFELTICFGKYEEKQTNSDNYIYVLLFIIYFINHIGINITTVKK
jgi:hypothetical protein